MTQTTGDGGPHAPYGTADQTQPLAQGTPPYAGPRPTSAYPVQPPPPYGYGGQPQRNGGGKALAGVVLAGALVLGLAGGVSGAAIYQRLSDTREVSASQVQGLDPLDVVSVSTVARQVLPSVVTITAVTEDGTGGTGSGSVISADGEVITNNHVVDIADTEDASLTISFADGSNRSAELVGRDPRTDLALLKVEDATGLRPIEPADSDRAQVGQAVVAVGSPYGLDSTVTAGIISALHRPVVIPLGDGSDGASIYGAIQTDAPINPGNSGGALVDMAGQLVGINSVIRLAAGSSEGQGDQGNIGIGYAIPVNTALPIIEQLRNGEEPTHARLGVSGQAAQVSPGVTGGTEVTDVSDGSAAEAAGLEDGDVITEVGDLQVASFEGLQAAVYSFRPGDTVTITFWRGGEVRTAEVTFDSDAE